MSGIRDRTVGVQPLEQGARACRQRPEQVPPLLPPGFDHAPQDQEVGGARRRPQAAGDLLLRLLRPQVLLGLIIGRRNQGIAQESQRLGLEVAQPDGEVVALAPLRPPLALRTQRRQRLMIVDAVAGQEAAVLLEVGDLPFRQPGPPAPRLVGGGDRRNEVEAEILGPDLVAGLDQPLQVPQVAGAAAGMLDALDVETGAEMVVHRDPGRLGHDVAAAPAEAEMAEELRAGDADPAQPAGDPGSRLVEMLDRRSGRRRGG